MSHYSQSKGRAARVKSTENKDTIEQRWPSSPYSVFIMYHSSPVHTATDFFQSDKNRSALALPCRRLIWNFWHDCTINSKWPEEKKAPHVGAGYVLNRFHPPFRSHLYCSFCSDPVSCGRAWDWKNLVAFPCGRDNLSCQWLCLL